MQRTISLFIFSIVAFFAMSCASSKNDRQAVFVSDIENSPELVAIDASIETLGERTKALEDEYAEIEKVVLAHAKFEGEPDHGDDSLKIYVNENNAIIVNDTAMTRNEFGNFIDKKLPALCTPAPTLKVHARANYDTAASLLEMIYARGCTDVAFE